MIARFRVHVRRVRSTMVAGLAASAVAAAMDWATPWPLKFIFDSVLGSHPMPAWLSWLPHDRSGLMAALAAGMVVVAGVLAVADHLSTRLVATAGQEVVFGIRCELFSHIEAQSQAFFQRRRTGDLMARLGGDVQAVQSAMVTAVPTLVRNVLTLVGMVSIMLVVDWRYALLALSLVPLLFVTTRRYLERIKSLQRQARRADGVAGSIAQEALGGIAVVQAFAAEGVEADRYAAATRRGLVANRHAIVAQAQLTPLMTFAMTVSTVLVMYFGVRAVEAGHLTPGDLLVFSAYLRGMYSPVRQLSKLAGVVGRAHAAAERVVEVLDTDERVPQRPGARRVARVAGELELAGVRFAYLDGTPVLHGVDLLVPAGARQALVGATGSGKSTLLRLVPRFADPTAGTLRLDGADVADLDLRDLRRQVALVPQEPVLLGTTVWENILYGTPGRDPAGAVAAARAAGLHDVIESFPRGYDTLVGERGAQLSGGQRQCVAVARAMARNAPVLLLDEPTTGLDAELESVLLAALERLVDGRTTIMITHQLAGLARADRIAVLDQGRIVESGAHGDLMDRGGLYWRLQRLQRGEAVPGGAALRRGSLAVAAPAVLHACGDHGPGGVFTQPASGRAADLASLRLDRGRYADGDFSLTNGGS